MTQTEVKTLASGKSDGELHLLGRKYGLHTLACQWEGLDPAREDYKTTDFSRENPFVHLAWREGHVARVIEQAIPIAGESYIPGADGKPLPVTRTMFKGEAKG